MKTKEIDVFYHKSISLGMNQLSHMDLSVGYCSEDYILLGKGKATIELFEVDERILAADKLEEKKKKLIADQVIAIEKLDKQIQELRSLTHQES